MSSKTLAKAILVRLKQVKGTGKNAKTTIDPEPKGAFPVQFNPTSLKISQQNNVDAGGATTMTQRRQNPSSQSSTLSFDLEFDTAEEIGDGGPVDVRTKTMIIRQFTEPAGNKGKDPPPLLKFIWGTFTFVGIVTQLTEDIDLFSPEGRPIRAKVSVTVKEVRLDIEAKTAGAGARTGESATPPGEPNPASGAPGTPPAPNPDTAALAQLGESLQQLLARLNADPATWRAAMAGLDSPLALAAGAQVQLSAGASAGLGLAGTAGFAAGLAVGGTASLAGALGVSGGIGIGGGIGVSGEIGVGGGVAGGGGFGVSAGAGVTGGLVAAEGVSAGGGLAVGGVAAAGFALAEGGGVVASAHIVATAEAEASVQVARASFEVPVVSAGASASVSAGVSSRAAVGVRVPPVDPRTQTYGQGIPLRAQITLG
jgi:Contractile injection system tube protein